MRNPQPNTILVFTRDFESCLDEEGILVKNAQNYTKGDICILLRYASSWYNKSICHICSTHVSRYHYMVVLTRENIETVPRCLLENATASPQ